LHLDFLLYSYDSWLRNMGIACDNLTTLLTSLCGFHLRLLGQCQVLMILLGNLAKNWWIFVTREVTRDWYGYVDALNMLWIS